MKINYIKILLAMFITIEDIIYPSSPRVSKHARAKTKGRSR